MSATDERGQRRWFDREETDEDQRGRSMVDAAKAIKSSPDEGLRSDLNLLYGSMYEGRQLTSLYRYGGPATAQGMLSGSEVTWNLTRSVVNTVASQVARNRPRCRFVTTKGNAKQKRRAKKLTTFTDGLFHETNLYEKTQAAFTDAGVFDVGAIQVYRDGDRVAAKRIRACEILVDSNDAIDGTPRTLYLHRFIDRGVVLASFGDTEERKEAIRNATAADPVGDGSPSNMIEVFEAWHLPSKKGGKDGIHLIALDSKGGAVSLVEEDYAKDYFPVFMLSWDPALAGLYGTSAAHTLMPIQVAVNTLLDKIARGHHLQAVPRVAIQRGSKIIKSQISNAPGSIIEYTGSSAPSFFTPQAFGPEIYQHLERHFQRGYELYGVNADFASGRTDTGAAAIKVREDIDVQTARFAVLAQRWEQFHMAIAGAMVDIARDIYEDNESFRVSAPGTALLESIDWEDVDLEEDAYVIQAYPTSLLPTTPQGRIDRVEKLVVAGIWTPQRAEAALDDLDPESTMARARASEKLIERRCEEAMLDGKYTGPEPWMDLAACSRIGAEYLAEALEDDEIPARNVELLYMWLDDVSFLKKALTPPAPPPMPGVPGAPGPMPGPAPMAAAA